MIVKANAARIVMVDKPKKTAADRDYCNAGFFSAYKENGQGFTLPVAHLVCDYEADSVYTKKYCTERGKFVGGKFLFDSGKWEFDNPCYGKNVSTLIIKDGIASIRDIKNLVDCDYAISGVPIMRDGKDVTFKTYVKSQGWDASSLYATYHIFVGLKEKESDTLYIMCEKTKTSNMITSAEAYKKFKALGFYDVIKLDGGGSAYFNDNGEVVSTSENRRINTIITWENEIPEEGSPVKEIVAKAKSQIGVKENPSGSNKVKYNTEYYGRVVCGSAYPWCCTFIWWLFKKCGASDLFYGGKKTASCTTLMSFYKQKGQFSKTPKVGGLVFFNWGSGAAARHIGIVTKLNADGSITTIEGNTAIGNDSNGGEVMQRTRYSNQILGYAYPYTGGSSKVTITLDVLRKGSKGDSVKALQILLNGYGYSCGTADGDFGAKTEAAVKKFQKAHGLTADGIVGQATWNALLA